VDPAVFQAKAAEGETLRAAFTVANDCGDVVRILGAQTTCSCTVSEDQFPIVLNPGTSAKLTFKVTAGRPSGSDNVFEKQVKLFVDRAGKTPELKIRIALAADPHR
jgi:hypothetical protein